MEKAPMKEIEGAYLTTVGELVDFLEKEISEGRNPTTPEEWQAFLDKMIEAKKVKLLASGPDTRHTVDTLVQGLTEQGLNVKYLNGEKSNERTDADVDSAE
jgi:hypothetical protein